MTNPFHSWHQHSATFHSKHRVTHHSLDSRARQNVKCSLILKEGHETGKYLRGTWPHYLVQQRNLAKVHKKLWEVWKNLMKTDSVVEVPVGWSTGHHRRIQRRIYGCNPTIIILVFIYLFIFMLESRCFAETGPVTFPRSFSRFIVRFIAIIDQIL